MHLAVILNFGGHIEISTSLQRLRAVNAYARKTPTRYVTLAFLPGSCYILAHVQMLRYLLTLDSSLVWYHFNTQTKETKILTYYTTL